MAIDELAELLGLTELLDRRAKELSGGERRRLHTAIALVGRPSLVLLDEPTVGADVQTRTQLLGVVRDLAREVPRSSTPPTISPRWPSSTLQS